MNARLCAFRQYHHLETQEVARELSLTIDEYQLLEEGKTRVDEPVAEKLAGLYKAPPEIFLDKQVSHPHTLVYAHCTFTDHSNGYVNHLYPGNAKTAVWLNSYVKDPQVLSLKEEIKRLREQNEKLIAALIESRHL